ncbi:MAG: hypothetical protein HC842_00345 [Cytophagales bacterium]|nr:hypothetical protein [Cytophagales bacterium]
MKRWFYKLLNHGSEQTRSYKIKRTIRFFNMVTLIAMVNIFVYAIKNLFIGAYTATLLEVVVLGILFYAFWLNKRHHQVDFVIVLLLMEFFFLALSLYIFPGKRVELFFIFLAITPHIFFKIKCGLSSFF